MIASRTIWSKCDRLVAAVHRQRPQHGHPDRRRRCRRRGAALVDAHARATSPTLVINVALPYQDLTIMEACLKACGCQLPRHGKLRTHVTRRTSNTAGSGSYREALRAGGPHGHPRLRIRPGCLRHIHRLRRQALLRRDPLRLTSSIAMLADHHKAFATNFNPEINIREITQKGLYYEDGKWLETDPLADPQDAQLSQCRDRARATSCTTRSWRALVLNFPSTHQARSLLDDLRTSSISPISTVS